MTPSTNRDNFPKPVLMAIGGMLALTVVSIAVMRTTRAETDQPLPERILMEKSLRFEDDKDGSISVLDATTQSEVAHVAPGTNGFLRSTLRGLARERKRRDLGDGPPFVLAIVDDGRLTIDDPATGRHVELDAFGQTNASVFREILIGQKLATASPGVSFITR